MEGPQWGGGSLRRRAGAVGWERGAEGCEGQGAVGAGWRSPEAEVSVGKVVVLSLFLDSCLSLQCCVGVGVCTGAPTAGFCCARSSREPGEGETAVLLPEPAHGAGDGQCRVRPRCPTDPSPTAITPRL